MRFHGLVVAALLVSGIGVACGEPARKLASKTADQPAGGVDRLADLSSVMPGRRPEIAVAGTTLVASSGADLRLTGDAAHLAVSTNGGRTFRAVPFEHQLYNLGIDVRGHEAIVVGSHCAEPLRGVDGISCRRSNERLQAFTVDLTSFVTNALPDPPVQGFVSDSVGDNARASMFTVSRDDGPVLLSLWRSRTWTVEALPEHTARACTAGDTVVAVTNGRPIGSPRDAAVAPATMDEVPVTVPAVNIEPVRRGEILWTASVSYDQGATWSNAIPFRSEAEQDFAFAVGVACGPSMVAGYTGQLGVFSPTSRTWSRVAVPDTVAIGPGVAVGWTSSDALRMWSLPTADEAAVEPGAAPDDPAPRLEHRRIDVTFRDGRPTRVSAGPADEVVTDLDGLAPQDLRGSGAEKSGYLLLAGNGRVVLANMRSS